jgi:transposase
MTPENYVLKGLILPDLKLNRIDKISNSTFHYHCEKTSDWEVCRKCPTKSYSVHDRRDVTIRDAKLRGKHIKLIITKRRFRCPDCKSVFTESIPGIKVGYKTTENYRNLILHDVKKFENTISVSRENRCSSTFVTKVTNERLELELRKTKNTPWGKTVLIDEHGFMKNKIKGRKDFVTAFVDNNRKCLRELAPSRDHADLEESIKHIPGKENVRNVVIDMSETFKNFALNYFPNAKLIVDKFHVIRLIHPTIRKYRKEVTGDARKNPIRHLLLKNRSKLKPHEKEAVTRFCRENEKVNEVYWFKERISNFYRIKGFDKARTVFIKITDDLSRSSIPELKTLRRTLMKWREEILRYFKTGHTNARVEGFNRKCKLIQRKAYGFKSFQNYRLRALYSCS